VSQRLSLSDAAYLREQVALILRHAGNRVAAHAVDDIADRIAAAVGQLAAQETTGPDEYRGHGCG
jgi:hypothetical protein